MHQSFAHQMRALSMQFRKAAAGKCLDEDVPARVVICARDGRVCGSRHYIVVVIVIVFRYMTLHYMT